VRRVAILSASLATAFLLVLGLAACGSEGGSTPTDESPSTSATTTSSQEGGGDSDGQGSQGSPSDSKESDDSNGSHANIVPLRVSGGGSTQFRSKGGDNSVQEYGEEGDESELQQAAEAVHDFYVARAQEEWASACSYLASSTLESLEQLAASSPKLKDKGCPAALQALTPAITPELARESTTVDAGSLRRDGEQGFLIYFGLGKTVYSILMKDEDGEWKVGALAGSVLR